MSFSTGDPQWICFICGIEVPVIAAATSTNANQLATAQITLPYSPFLSKLPKHTKITLFSFDASSYSEPQLEFDGVIQNVSWRKDKISGNTGLFIMAQTDGIIWSERKKFNFYLDNAFGQSQLLKSTQEYETYGTISESPLSDPLANLIQSVNYDGGEAATLFLTHTFNETNPGSKKFSGDITYVDCGYYFKISNSVIDDSGEINKNYYAEYIDKYYRRFNVLRKICRVAIPDIWKTSFASDYDFKILTNQIAPLEGEVNFWNYATYICDNFNFEIYDIPDCNYVNISNTYMKKINRSSKVKINTNGSSILSEYLIKPKSKFGPVPYCNVIFPDQVLDKSFFKNFQNETTRVYTRLLSMVTNAMPNVSGVQYNGKSGPYSSKKDDLSYFSSFNLKDPNFDTGDTGNKKFLLRSDYEEEYGVLSKYIELPDTLTRLLITKGGADSESKIQNMLNHEFFTSYTEKVSFNMQVSPDVTIIPGMSVLVLDENDEHILAYCFGREKIWDKNGQVLINLKLSYPRLYNMEVGFANEYLNTFDPIYYSKSYQDDLKIMSEYIGSDFLDPKIEIKEHIIKLMKNWTETYKKDSNSLRRDEKYIRKSCLYSDFLKFHNVSGNYNFSIIYNKMPETLINTWDTSEKASTMKALQYSYSENGYKNTQSTTDNNPPYKPSYNELSSPGNIKVSPYISGIVDCHNKYLMNIGNDIS